MKSFRKRRWTDLDNAAKIFPPTSTKKSTNVFRFACELKHSIDKNILQEALNKTMISFPIFTSVLKKGLFWYYLESSNIKPKVYEENLPPCSKIYDKNKNKLLFRVSYFNNRINLEVYHALTDGTGALQFLRFLVYNYIIIKYKDSFKNIPRIEYDASDFQKEADSFQKYYDPTSKKGKIKKEKAYQIKYIKHFSELNVISGIVSVKEMLNIAHKYNTSLTVFLTALFIKSIEMEMALRDKKHPIAIAIPINLRNFFESKTVRNFFAVMDTKYKSKGDSSLENIIEVINSNFKEDLKKEKIQERINVLAALENNFFVRPIPLFIKDFILKLAAKYTDKQTTASLSNIGKIEMPDEMSKYINSFDVFVSTNRIQLCVCSYMDNLTLSFTAGFENTDIQKNFFGLITDMGLKVKISTTLEDKGDENEIL